MSPVINNFDDISRVKITYTWQRQEDDHQVVENSNRNSEQEDDSDIENQAQAIPLLPPPNSKSFSGPPPHVLEELDVTWQGVLTAEASDGRYKARCQIHIQRGMYRYAV